MALVFIFLLPISKFSILHQVSDRVVFFQVSAGNGSKKDNKKDCNSTQETERFVFIWSDLSCWNFNPESLSNLSPFCCGLSASATAVSSSDLRQGPFGEEDRKPSVQVAKEACTPIQSIPVTNSKKNHQTAKKIASLVRNPSALRPKSQLQSSQSKKTKPPCLKR